MARRWIVYGGRGWIGSQWIEMLRDIYPEDSVVVGEARADHESEVAKEMLWHGPTHCVCAIGRTHGGAHSTIDYLEEPGALRENLRDNLYAPLILAETCHHMGVHMTYIGTGCIFEYDGDGERFDESAQPNFFGSSYSTVKGFTDRLMRTHYDRCVLNVRIRMPISGEPHPRNFLSKIISYTHIHSCPNSMTVLEDAIPATIALACRRETGTINMVNPGVMDHDTILRMYRDLCDPDHTWTLVPPETLAESGRIQAQRSNNHLDTQKLESLFPEFPTLEDSVRLILLGWGARATM